MKNEITGTMGIEMIRRTKNKRRRNGTALVELAVCLPVLVLLVLGSIELSNFIFLKQAVTAAAYEATRDAIGPAGTDASALASADAVLLARRLTGATVAINPSASVARGDLITVTVSAPSSLNRVVIPKFVAGLSVSASTTMVKE